MLSTVKTVQKFHPSGSKLLYGIKVGPKYICLYLSFHPFCPSLLQSFSRSFIFHLCRAASIHCVKHGA
ncbi:hypothetical protein FRX31_030631 [Thalictrum thalictroides]|uniref:Uncharacterized protein n=1 Tax=Thalictrum thalictroides TaxID=46969 RepID=A0A7J6V5T8_THATH|nr:hypothetical protein FRX31_030631 [Thalictrum thalictroides]